MAIKPRDLSPPRRTGPSEKPSDPGPMPPGVIEHRADEVPIPGMGPGGIPPGMPEPEPEPEPQPQQRRFSSCYVVYKAFFEKTPPIENFALLSDMPDIRTVEALNVVVHSLMQRHEGAVRVLVQNWKPLEG